MSDCQARELILTGHFKSLLFNLNFLARLPKYMALLRFQNRMNIYLPLDLWRSDSSWALTWVEGKPSPLEWFRVFPKSLWDPRNRSTGWEPPPSQGRLATPRTTAKAELCDCSIDWKRTRPQKSSLVSSYVLIINWKPGWKSFLWPPISPFQKRLGVGVLFSILIAMFFPNSSLLSQWNVYPYTCCELCFSLLRSSYRNYWYFQQFHKLCWWRRAWNLEN